MAPVLFIYASVVLAARAWPGQAASACAASATACDELQGSREEASLLQMPKLEGLAGEQQLVGSRPGRTRRSSGATSLQHGPYPNYSFNPSYVNPLTGTGLSKEPLVLGNITASKLENVLDPILNFTSRSQNRSRLSQKAAKHIRTVFQGMGLRTCVQAFNYGNGKRKNVIAFVKGKNRRQGSVVVGAHYDTKPSKGPAPGANDNGSGVAAMLAIAQAFQDNQWLPHKAVYFVGFAAGEDDIHSSSNFVTELQNNAVNLPRNCRPKNGFVAGEHQAIILTMVGWETNDPNFANPALLLETKDFAKPVAEEIAQAANDYTSLTVTYNNMPYGSDHMPFLDKNMSAVLAIQADDMDYPDYHQDTDNKAAGIDLDYMEKITKAAAGGLLRLANSRE